MTLAEQFKCSIPSADAIKDGFVYCSTNATNWADNWTAISAVITAVTTVGLLAGVWLAYKQIKDTQQMHDDQQQLDALARYITSIQYFGDLQATTEDELIRASTEMRTAGTLFRMAFRVVEAKSVSSLRKFDDALLKFVLLEFRRRGLKPYKNAHGGYAQAITQLTTKAVDTLPQLRLPGFTLKNLSEILTDAINQAKKDNPDYEIEAMVTRSMQARQSQ